MARPGEAERQRKRKATLKEDASWVRPRAAQFAFDPSGTLVVLMDNGTLWRREEKFSDSGWRQIPTPQL